MNKKRLRTLFYDLHTTYMILFKNNYTIKCQSINEINKYLYDLNKFYKIKITISLFSFEHFDY